MKSLNINEKQEIKYCIPTDLRDAQIKINLGKVKGRVEPVEELRKEPIAIVCFGPSLRDTWQELKKFKYIMTCSGAHKFLIDRGIVPTYHCLQADSILQTELGKKTIKWVVDNKYEGKVLSINDKGEFVWNKVLNWFSKSSRNSTKRWVRVKFSKVGNKRRLVCTEDHKILVFDDLMKIEPYYLEASKSLGKYAIRNPIKGKFHHRDNALYNKDQMSVIFGIMMGDGHIGAGDGMLQIVHGNPQRQYNEFIQSILGGSITNVSGIGFGQLTHKNVLKCPINAQTKYLRQLFYPNGVKTVRNVLEHLDEMSLAFWYMDDGSLRRGQQNHRPHMILCTDGFSKEDHSLMIDFFHKKWGLNPRILNDRGAHNKAPCQRIRFRAEDSEKIFRLISQYIPSSMEYKIPEEFRGTKKYVFNSKPLSISAGLISEVYYPIVKRGHWCGGKFYDIEVENVHNFVANDIVVHNCDLEPREYKVKLLGKPHKDVEYLIASTVHPRYLDALEGYNVKLWHIFASEEDAQRVLPRGEWSLCGGSSIGLRCLTMARFLGFTDLHIFGLDGSFPSLESTHTTEHPNAPKELFETEYDGKKYFTTPSMSHCCKETWKELDQLPNVKATFYGEGLTQHMAKHYKPNPRPAADIAFNKPELISKEYLELNKRLHQDNPSYGMSGSKYTDTVIKLSKELNTRSILDFGCGKMMLAKSLPFPIYNYDPAIPEVSEPPKPADLVICSDVLEHIEPDRLAFVLDELRRLTLKVGYFVIHTGPAQKNYANGKNAHLLQHDEAWWRKKLEKYFTIGSINLNGKSLHVVVGPKVKETKVESVQSMVTIDNGGTTCKFYTPNETTLWRAKSILTKEPVTTKWVNDMKAGETLFDIGANVGGYSVLAGTKGVKVYAFEPESENYALLVKNMALNGLDPNAYCVALSDKRELGSLTMSQAGVGGSCHSFTGKNLLTFNENGRLKQGCYGITLDELVESGQLPQPDHIKIDVDGLEPKVLAGAKGTLTKGVKSLLVEINTKSADHLEAVKEVERLGYQYDQSQVDGSMRKEGSFKGVAEYLFRKAGKTNVVVDFKNRELTKEPFPHLYATSIWSPETYAAIQANLPKEYTPISESRNLKGYPSRFTASPDTPFWRELFGNMRDGRLRRQLCEVFGVTNPDDYTDECLLVRDLAGYAIGPHTDSPSKIITVLFYLPTDDSLIGAGTSLYIPKKEGFKCHIGKHYPFEGFTNVKTMGFVPNSVFAFRKTDDSFHGVEPCGGTRNVLLYDIRKKS